MDIKDFEKQATPGRRRSRLDRFIDQIFELHRKGYTLVQIAQFLDANGEKVTPQTVHKFIKARQATGFAPDANAPQTVPAVAAPASAPTPTQRPEDPPDHAKPLDVKPEAGRTISDQILNSPTPRYSYKHSQKGRG